MKFNFCSCNSIYETRWEAVFKNCARFIELKDMINETSMHNVFQHDIPIIGYIQRNGIYSILNLFCRRDSCSKTKKQSSDV